MSATRHRRPNLFANYAALLGVLAVLVALFSLLSEHFLSVQTFTALINQIPDLIVIAVGMTFVVLVAGIDLSVGSVLALGGAALGVAMVDWGWSIPAAVLLAGAVGFGCGLANGFVTVRWTVPSFIVTLGMLEMARGGAYLLTGSQTKYIGETIGAIGAPIPWLRLSPAVLAALLIVVAGQIVLDYTRFGRYVFAVGGNEAAAHLSGLDVRAIKLRVFALSGLLAGIGGVFHCSPLESANPNAGGGMELSAIAAVVIGGASLIGGRGSVVNSFLGVLIIAVLQTGLAQVGASEPAKRLITGLVIVAAVVADAYRRRNR